MCTVLLNRPNERSFTFKSRNLYDVTHKVLLYVHLKHGGLIIVCEFCVYARFP